MMNTTFVKLVFWWLLGMVLLVPGEKVKEAEVKEEEVKEKEKVNVNVNVNVKEETIINTRIIFDTDPGIDDSLALLWLFEMARGGILQIEGVTAVQGNTFHFNSFRNIIHLVNLTLGDTFFTTNPKHPLPIPIGKYNLKYGGLKLDDQFFGGDGFSGLSERYLSEECLLTSKLDHVELLHQSSLHSEELIIQLLNKYPYQLTIVAVGPLTNLAAAEKLQPGILSQAKSIIIMGGVFTVQKSNAHALSEFNFRCDAQSTLYFFETISKLHAQNKRAPEVLIFPLDVTSQLKLKTSDLNILETLLAGKKLSERGTHLLAFIRDILRFQFKSHFEWGYGYEMHMHDPATIGFLLYPHIFSFKKMYARVDGETGMIYYDARMVNPYSIPKDIYQFNIPNVWVCFEADANKFINAFIRDMALLLATI